MKKLEIIQLHRLMDNVRDYMTESFPDFLEEETTSFSKYESLNVSPIGVKTNKEEQKKALLELNEALVDFSQNSDELIQERIIELSDQDDIDLPEDDDELVKLGAEVLSENDLRRPEAAKTLALTVEYTPSTVYDKFSDFGVLFKFHGEEKRDSAVKDLQDYAEGSLERNEALELVSKDYDVPEGTLKNWLTEEDIRFTQEISAVLTPDSCEELIETAEHYFDFRSDAEPMEQSLNRQRETLRQYKEEEIETIPVEVLENLDSLFNSEPRYRLDKPERYIQDETGRGLVLEDDFQEFLFSHVSTNEFADMTGSSRTSYSRYTQNKTKNVDEDAFRKVFQVVSYMYEKHPEPEIEAFVDRNSYTSSTEGFENSVLDPEILPYELRSLTG